MPFTPPPVESHQGVDPAFAPPPVSSHQGPDPSFTPPPPVEAGFHPLDSVRHGIHEFWNQVDPVSQTQGLAQAVSHPLDFARAMAEQNAVLWGKTTRAYDAGNYVGAVGHGINYALNGIPGLGTALDSAGEQFGRGDIAGGVGSSLGIVANLVAPGVAPKVAGRIGALIQRGAEPVAETALGISNKQRMFGKTPGRAALDETTGFTPAAVAESAKAKSRALMQELEAKAAVSPNKVSLQPARDVIDARAAAAAAGNNAAAAAELAPARAHLTKPVSGFAGAVDPVTGDLAVDQAALDALRLKREFGKAHTRWNNLKPNGEMGTARNAYRKVDQEFDRAVPEAADLNQRVSSLIPVEDRSLQNDLNAGFLQRNAHRIAAHTGALVGATEGFRYGGLPGAVAGLVVPEMLASPTARMAAARGINAAGKLVGGSPGKSIATGAAALNAIDRRDHDPLGLQRFIQQ